MTRDTGDRPSIPPGGWSDPPPDLWLDPDDLDRIGRVLLAPGWHDCRLGSLVIIGARFAFERPEQAVGELRTVEGPLSALLAVEHVDIESSSEAPDFDITATLREAEDRHERETR